MIHVNPDGSLRAESAEEAVELSRLIRLRNASINEVYGKTVRTMDVVSGYPKEAMYGKVAVSNGTKVEETEEQTVDTLLRAGGYKLVKRPLREIYALMLKQPAKLWDAHTIGKKLDRPPARVTAILSDLCKRNVIERVVLGSYRIR